MSSMPRAVGVIGLLLANSVAIGTATFAPLGTSVAFDVSDNGNVVAGSGSFVDAPSAWVWHRDEGLTRLTTGGSDARAVSGDGTTVVGLMPGSRAFRWTQADGVQQLSSLSPSGSNMVSRAYDVSSDGRITVGYSQSYYSQSWDTGWELQHAVLWDENGVLHDLRPVGMGVAQSPSLVRAITPDADVLVGTNIMVPEADYYRRSTGETHEILGESRAVSADGTTVVGSNGVPFRWNTSGSYELLGDLPGGLDGGGAQGVSGDGSVVVGWSFSSLGQEAFLWHDDRGMRRLQDVLSEDYGLVLPGWRLDQATAISPDAIHISGFGHNPDGVMEAFVISLPAPPTAVVGLVFSVIVARRRR